MPHGSISRQIALPAYVYRRINIKENDLKFSIDKFLFPRLSEVNERQYASIIHRFPYSENLNSIVSATETQ